MKICRDCGTELPGLARFCPACGKRVEEEFKFRYHEEEESEFAFHTEYYGAAVDSDSLSISGKSCSYTWQDGTMYHLYQHYQYNYTNEQDYLLKVAQDGNIQELFPLDKWEGKWYRQLCSNRHGIFLTADQNVVRCDFQGNTKNIMDFATIFGEENRVNNYYIFGSKIYAALSSTDRNNEKGTLNGLGICVQSYDFVSNQKELIWSLTQKADELEAFMKEQLKGQILKYGHGEDPNKAEQLIWSNNGAPNVWANSQYAVITFDVLAAPADAEGYDQTYNPLLLVDFKTGSCVDMKGESKGKEALVGVRLDLRRNKMWFPYKNDRRKVDSLVEFPIGNWDEIDLEQYEDCWHFDMTSDRNFEWDKCYFDGQHAYRADGLYHFFAYQKDGICAGEWNCSGHGNTRVTVLGSYVYAILDYNTGIYKHSIDLPEKSYFQIDKEAVEQMICDWEAQKKATEVDEQEKTIDIEVDETAKAIDTEGEEPAKPVDVEKDELAKHVDVNMDEPEKEVAMEQTGAFNTMSVLEFREFFQECSDYSEQFKEFRKSLKDDKWDFNVVMGILLGSCKRHATGPRHIQEQNAGIGQGDNKDMVVVTLNQYDMMDLYNKYEKISAPDVKVAAVMKEICERKPKLTAICDTIQTILQ